MMTPKLNTETFQTLIDRTGNQEQKSHNLYAKGGGVQQTRLKQKYLEENMKIFTVF